MPNIESDMLFEELRGMLVHRHRSFAGALVTYALSKREAPAFTCKWMMLDESVTPRDDQDYAALSLGEHWVSMENVLSELSALISSKHALGAFSLPGQISYISSDERAPYRHTLSGWRERAYTIKVGDRQGGRGFLQDSVVRRGMRPYGSEGKAAMSWVWPEVVGRRDDLVYLDELVIVLPDTRARIARADWVGNILTLEVEANVPHTEVELQVQTYGEGEHQLMTAPDSGTGVVELPAATETVELYLLHGQDDLLGEIHLNRRGDQFKARAGDASPEEQAKIDLAGGESDLIEYKPFIEPKDFAKEAEVVRTVVAFSNTSGGRIYMGVFNDSGMPIGDAQLRTAGKAETEQAGQNLVDRIRTVISDRVKPVPDVAVDMLTIYGEPVILVSVPEGNQRPYATIDNDVFVRKGSNNMKPDPRTEMPALLTVDLPAPFV